MKERFKIINKKVETEFIVEKTGVTIKQDKNEVYLDIAEIKAINGFYK